MGKSKKQQRQRQQTRCHDELPSSAFDGQEDRETVPPEQEVDDDSVAGLLQEVGSSASVVDRHALYQRAVQSPKGDISYMQKFFLNYIGRRSPAHFREDFCGTALLCAEWVRGDTRRTAVGVDLDMDALSWGTSHNMSRLGPDAQSRVHLFHGNVLHPVSMEHKVHSTDEGAHVKTDADKVDDASQTSTALAECVEDISLTDPDLQSGDSHGAVPDVIIHPADIICAFNYSCCCLHKRADLISYFERARKLLSAKGGIFVMDLYGGASSERALKLRRRFEDFTYTWEQEAFDVLTRTTRISLHFQSRNHRVLRRAFSYSWRLWTIPEVRDCLEEAGFGSTHLWVEQMPDLQGRNPDSDVETDCGSYEEVTEFQQCDAWNAYIVAVSKATLN